MNPSLATAILVAAEGALFALPLMPALLELRLKRDAEPLTVIQDHSGDVRYFAFGFRNYIADLQEPLRKCVETGTSIAGRRKNGEQYVLLGNGCGASFAEEAKVKNSISNVVICAGTDLCLPPSLKFLKEVYAAKRLAGGEGNTYRAILGETEVQLGRGSKVVRWVHATERFCADHDCELFGRLSSDEEVLLKSGCVFQRVHAPRIVTSSVADMHDPPSVSASAIVQNIGVAVRERQLVDGDVDIPPGKVVAEHMIARGRLHVGAGAKVLGSLKSDQDLTIDAGASVEGSVISAGVLHIGRKCRIHGPVLAEHGIEIGSGTSCGAPDSPTTVSSPEIDIEEGALFFGTVWAREEGRVLARK